MKFIFFICVLWGCSNSSLSAQNTLNYTVDQLFSVVSHDNGSDDIIILNHSDFYITTAGLILYVGKDASQFKISFENSIWIEVPHRKPRNILTVPKNQVTKPASISDSLNIVGLVNADGYIISTSFGLTKRTVSNSKISSLKKVNSRLTANPFDTGKWIKSEITESGIYKITKSDLVRFGFSGNENSLNLTVFTADESTASETMSVGLWTKENEISTISETQEYYFYLPFYKGLRFNQVGKLWTHYQDLYDDHQYVIVGFSDVPGKRISMTDNSNLTTTTVTTEAKNLVWIEDESENILKSGSRWLGRSMNENTSQTMRLKLDHYKAGTTLKINTTVAARYSAFKTARFDLYEKNNSESIPFMQVSPFGVDLGQYTGNYANNRFSTKSLPGIPDEELMIKYQFVSNSTATGWIDWLEAEYTILLDKPKNAISFYLTPAQTPNNTTVKVSGFSSSHISVVNIDKESDPKLISSTVNAGDVQFKWSYDPAKPNRFVVADVAAAKSIGNFTTLPVINFENITSETDYIIISPAALLSEAERLVSHRNQQGWKGVVINIDHIYAVYSSGKQNIYAIRQFLRDVYSLTNQNFKNVLFFGDTSFDYKGLISASPLKNILPTYESDESFNQSTTYSTDDFFSSMVTQLHDIGVGRLPLNSISAAKNMVDKLISYDKQSEFDDWRNTITFVADDGLTSNDNDYDIHTANAEKVGSIVPTYLTKNKIYLINYPTIISSEGRRKPEVTRDLINTFNSGTVIVNYSGHGNTKVWTHERVLEGESFLSQVSNNTRLPFVITATCDFGKYDDNESQSAAELFVLKSGGGAVGLFTTTRLVYTSYNVYNLDGSYSTNNLALNYALFQYLFEKNQDGTNLSLGEVYRLSKNRIGYSDENLKKFSLLADPATRLLLPRQKSAFTDINKTFTSLDTIQLKTLQLNELTGQLFSADNSPMNNFNGEISVRLKGEPRRITIPEWGSRIAANFMMEGADIYRGSATVTNGKFTIRFFLPKDVLENSQAAKFSGYYWNDSNDGYLTTPNVFFRTGQVQGATDELGPLVRLYVNDSTFQNGQTVSPQSKIVIYISDSSGINTTGLGIGHQLAGIFDGNVNDPIDLSRYYSANKDDFTQGIVVYPINALTPGHHDFSIKVWDSFNNGNTEKIEFIVSTDNELEIGEVVPFPNPFSEKVRLYFMHNLSDADLKVKVSIYTANGLMIKSFTENLTGSTNNGFVEWNGYDNDGDQVANGIYLANVTIENLNSGKSYHKIAKIFYLK